MIARIFGARARRGGTAEAATPVLAHLQRNPDTHIPSHFTGGDPADLAHSSFLPEAPVKTLYLATSIVLRAPMSTAYARPDNVPDILAAVAFGAGERVNGSGSVHGAR